MKVTLISGALVVGMAMSLFSCVNQTERDLSDPALGQEPETAITKAEAIEGLSSLLRSWCSSELRSGDTSYGSHARMLAQLSHYDPDQVQTVRSGLNTSTRSAAGADTYHDPQPEASEESTHILHLVNFDGGGYAVVSADKRIPSFVLAVVDEGSIRESDFVSADSLYTEADIQEEMPDFKLYNDTLNDFYSMSGNRAYVNAELYRYASSYAPASCEISEPSHHDDSDRSRRSTITIMKACPTTIAMATIILGTPIPSLSMETGTTTLPPKNGSLKKKSP